MEVGKMLGSRLEDYILVISLPAALIAEVKRIKLKFADDYAAPQANQHPSIILSAFSALRLSEEKIIARLDAIAGQIKPFKIELRGFGSFPSHTIYIQVSSRLQITQLVKEIKKAQSLLKPDKDHKPYFIDEAHLAVCKKLKPWQFEKAWLEYSHLDFTSRFIASDLVLLRKIETGFQSVATLHLTGFGETVSQGNLFI